MSQLERLITQQEQAMNAVSRILPNFKKLGKSKWTPALIRQRLDNLKTAFAKCQNFDVEIILAATDIQRSTITYFVAQHFLACETMFDEASDYLAEALEDLEPKSPVTANSTAFEHTHRSRQLPAVNLPTFDGSLDRWESFRDRFQALISNDKSLPSVDKLHYLFSCLKRDAGKALGNLACTDANFEVAWKRLVSRFEDKRQLITSHIQTLLQLPSVKSRSADDLRFLRDSANAAVQALINLGRPIDQNDILVVLVVQKLDQSTRELWEFQTGNSREFPRYSELDDFLELRIRSLTMSSSQPPCGSSSRQYGKSKSISSHAVTTNIKCSVCQDTHTLYHCEQFRSYAPVRRFEFVQQQKLCLNCLSSYHQVSNCPSKRRCLQCSQSHHTLLHDAMSMPIVPSPNNPQTSESTVSSHMLSHASTASFSTLLATARVNVRSDQGRVATVRALLDQGSVATLVSESLSHRLGLKSKTTNLVVSGIGNAQLPAQHTARITVCPAHAHHPAFTTNAIILPSLTPYTPLRIRWSERWSHLSALTLADDDPFNSDPIDIIIGAELYGLLLLPGLRRGRANEPIAQNTALGWILSGRISSNSVKQKIYSNHCSLNESLDDFVRQFWTIEEVPEAPRQSPEDKECEEHFRQTHSRDTQGKYIVRLPFKSGPPTDLGDSRRIALNCLQRLEKRLTNDPTTANAYSEFLSEYLALGHMELILTNSISSVPRPYYIPHHGVYRESSTTSRLRVVFNASCGTTNGKSLNDYLFIGPKLQTELSSVLLTWRVHRYALCADIAKMYRQILIDPRDADYQRILWRPSQSDPVQEYRLLTVTYGTAAAPFLALRVLQQLVSDEGAHFPRAVPILQNHTYVDDCIFSAESISSAIETRNQLIALLARGGFALRKWASNCPDLLRDIDPSNHGLAGGIDMKMSESLNVLGLAWKPDRDTFHFRIFIPGETQKTKRRILSTISKFFDPLGWLSPVVITAKILLQKLWTLKCEWDDDIPSLLYNEWVEFQSQLTQLEGIEIPRWIGYNHDIKQVELHGFADASTSAYASVIYIRIIRQDDSTTVSLLVSKTKVAPLKTISVPRLELCACLLLAKLIHFVRSTLFFPSTQYYAWTDSTIALAWLRQSPSRWKTFVGNRVARIQHLTTDVSWNHIPSSDNPADCASQGLQPAALVNHHLWWCGPTWLSDDTAWPPQPSVEETVDLEHRTSAHTFTICVPEPWELQTRFSSWFKLLRITALVLRFVRRLRRRSLAKSDLLETSVDPASTFLHPEEITEAKRFWVKSIQASVFSPEIQALKQGKPVSKTSALAPLSPYLDSENLVRVRGRLRRAELSAAAKCPIVLKAHPLVTMLIADTHRKNLHAGPQLTLTLLRQEFWLLRARATVQFSINASFAPVTRQRSHHN